MPNLLSLRDLAVFYYTQRFRGFDSPTEPHFDPETLDAFRSALTKATCYLEFGSGGSTVEAGHLGIPTVSVDSDRFYARAVRKALPPEAPVHVIDADIGLTRQWGAPLFKEPNERRVRRWRNYTALPIERTRQSGTAPDLVLVDGRFRRACALAAARLIQELGATSTLVMDDYLGRGSYARVEVFLGPPRMVGRSAWFAISPDSVATITDEDIVEAHRDIW